MKVERHGAAGRMGVPRIVMALLVTLAMAAPAAYGAPFAGVMFEDGPTLRPEQLLPAYRDALGRPLDAALAEQVAGRLATHYQSGGFLPPAPRMLRLHEAAGVLVMEMREPQVARVVVDGREHIDSAEFWSLVRELRAMRPLGRAGFDAWLRRANHLGAPVRGSLTRDSRNPHQYVAHLRVDERRWGGVAHVDNRGPAQLGHEIAQLSVNYRFAREALGQLRLDVAGAVDHERLRYVGASGSHRLTSRGDRLQWKYARSESTLPIVDTTRSVDYERERAELRFAAPLARRTRHRADVSVALRSYDLDQWLDDGRLLRRDRIRAVDLSYDAIVATDHGIRHTVGLDLSRGIDALGASLWPDGPQGDFSMVNLEYGYRQRLNAAWQLLGNISAQASADRLPSSERFFIGGRNFGGAFDPATLSGDHGLGARIGLERLLPVAMLEQPLTAFAYYDHGWVWSKDGHRPADDAGSAGVGVRGQLRGLSWTVELGVPVQSPQTPSLLEDDARVFFSLSQRF